MSDVEFIQPFGPSILRSQLNRDLLSSLIDLSDDVLHKSEHRMGARLAGQIQDEFELPEAALAATGFSQFITDLANRYVRTNHDLASDEMHVMSKLKTAWVVSQHANEYNPVHSHAHCQLSGVAYLKMPPRGDARLAGKPLQDGNIKFICGSSGDLDQMSYPTWTIYPEAGDLVLFPSSLLHTVYPFRGCGERRSVAFNLIFRIADPVSGSQVSGDAMPSSAPATAK